MLKHVSKHPAVVPAVAVGGFRPSVGLVWVIGRLLSGDVNVTGPVGTDIIYKEIPI